MIIGFGSKARQGKDTAGEAVVNYYNRKRELEIKHGLKPATPAARLFKFADGVYRVAREEYGMKEKDATLLQKIGDGRRNEYGLTYWIDQLDKTMTGFEGVAVITDVRYINEAEWIKFRGGYVINVTRFNPDGSQFITTDRDPNFVSEVQLDNYNWDFFIKSKDAALTAELAITIAEFVRGLK